MNRVYLVPVFLYVWYNKYTDKYNLDLECEGLSTSIVNNWAWLSQHLDAFYEISVNIKFSMNN